MPLNPNLKFVPWIKKQSLCIIIIGCETITNLSNHQRNEKKKKKKETNSLQPKQKVKEIK